MTRDEIMALDEEAIETRRQELLGMIETDGADLDAIQAETDAIKERRAQIALEREERKADAAAVAAGAGEMIDRKENNMENIEIRNTPEYIEAYANYIKTGSAKECRALLTENVLGTVPVPELVEGRVRTAWEREGITARVRKSYLKGNLKIGFEISSTGATVHTEGGDPVAEETLVLGVVTLVPETIKKWISISDEVMDLRGEEFLNYIYDELTYQIAKKAADELVAKINACGTVSTTTCPAVGKITSTTVNIGLVAQCIAALSDEAANPTIIMNKATWAKFKEAQYAANFAVDPFEGREVVFNNSVASFTAATTGVTWLIVGDLDTGALMNFPNGNGIEFKFDDVTLATSDLVRVIGREPVGMAVVAPNHFVKVVK